MRCGFKTVCGAVAILLLGLETFATPGAAAEGKPGAVAKSPVAEAGSFVYVNVRRIERSIAADPKEARRIVEELIFMPTHVRFVPIENQLPAHEEQPRFNDIEERPKSGADVKLTGKRTRTQTDRIFEVDRLAILFHKDKGVALLRFRKPIKPQTVATLLGLRGAIRKTTDGIAYDVYSSGGLDRLFVWTSGNNAILAVGWDAALLLRYVKYGTTHGWKTLDPQSLAVARGVTNQAAFFMDVTAQNACQFLGCNVEFTPVGRELGEAKPKNRWNQHAGQLKRIRVQLDCDSDVPVSVSFVLSASASAKVWHTKIDEVVAGLHKKIRQQLSGRQDFKNGLTRAAWESDLMNHVLSGLHVRLSETTVNVTLRHHRGFPRLVLFVLREISRIGAQAEARFRDIADQLK